MLILQRRKGESVQIGDNVTVTIAGISSDRVRLAIDAPRETPINRTELLEAARINKEAADNTSTSLSTLRELLHTPKSKE